MPTAAAALPALSFDEQAHAERVRRELAERIAVNAGWLAFSDFMQFALYAPGLGYYAAGARKFGAGGDFITAPELTPVFARCVARQIAEVFEQSGGREIVEFGAGSGAFAVDLMSALAELGAAPERYSIVEVSADLRERQRERVATELGRSAACVHWLDGLPSTAVRGALIANEVLDAFPVERFRIAGGRVERLGVALAGGDLVLAARPAPALLEAAVRALPVMNEEGYVSEICPMLPGWVSSVAPLISSGVLFVMDYGLPRAQYYHPERRQGSLQCHFRQRSHDDPLTRIGLQDITAWVDFTAVAEAADAHGLDVLGFATQAHFLLSTGMQTEIDAHATSPEPARRAARQAANRLLPPGDMGEAFKVLALGRGIAEPLMGFALRDLRHTL
jgi:SAM-dependent MidA family methyltransferase